MRALPGPRGHPLLGHAAEFNVDPRGFLLRRHAEYGDLFRFRIGLQAQVVVSRLDDISAILHSRDGFTDGALPARWGDAYVRSVSRIEGAEHLARRRLLQPAFGSERLRSLAEAVAPLGWPEGRAEATAGPVWTEIKQQTFDGLVALLLGPEGSAQSTELA